MAPTPPPSPLPPAPVPVPASVPAPTPPSWPIPKLQLRIDDLSHLGASVFLEAVRPKEALEEAVLASFRWLYTPETVPRNVQNILLVLRPFDGVAHTFGSPTHKEIHFSLTYIKASRRNPRTNIKDEIMGVLVHEVVHCYQYDAGGTCPGGLIEGVADYVRLNSNLAPPHWRRSPGERWDEGYDRTAYFLSWLEARYGDGTIRELNAWLGENKWRKRVFRELTGRGVKKLWRIYCRSLEEGEGGDDEEGEGVRKGWVVIDKNVGEELEIGEKIEEKEDATTTGET